MPLDIPNLDFIRNLTPENIAELGPKLAEALQGIQKAVNNGEMQANSNVNGPPQAPPAINALRVTGKNGHFNVAIEDGNEIYRGVDYFVEHADNPNFTNPTVVPMGASRNGNLFLGNTQRYFRAYSAYQSSAPGPAAYHGDAATPLAVEGGGDIGPSDFLPSQGSGTGAPGVGLSGPGPVPFRSTNGVPPVR